MNLSKYLKISPFFQAWTTRPPWSSRGAENAKHLKAHWVGWIWKKISRNPPGQKEKSEENLWLCQYLVNFCYMTFMVFLLLYFLFKICWFLNSWTLQNSCLLPQRAEACLASTQHSISWFTLPNTWCPKLVGMQQTIYHAFHMQI